MYDAQSDSIKVETSRRKEDGWGLGVVTKEKDEGGRVMYVSTVRRSQNGLGRQGGSTFQTILLFLVFDQQIQQKRTEDNILSSSGLELLHSCL